MYLYTLCTEAQILMVTFQCWKENWEKQNRRS